MTKSPGMHPITAASLVFVTSFVTLVLEILGSRLLAPFIGVTLETYTAVIGTILTGISIGTWLGGRLADRLPARSLLGPLLLLGGFAVLLVVPIARGFGPGFGSGGPAHIIALTFVTLFFPAAILSAINPTVVKLQLSDLANTGRIVGRLSATGTAGAIIGTFATGFLLVGTFPISHMIVAAGVGILAFGALLTLVMSFTRRKIIATVGATAVLAVIGSMLTTHAKNPCDVESSYYCISVLADEHNPSGRILKLDNIFHGYVDLANARNLDFAYSKVVGGVIDNAAPATEPISFLSVGGGSFTMARYVATTRPGSTNDALEIDPEIVNVAKEQLGLNTSDIRVHVGDARTHLKSVADGTYDVALGDAFGGESVPWQLTTKEFNDEIARVMTPDGIYVANLIDFDKLEFVRAELQTLRQTYSHVSLVGFPGDYKGVSGGNAEIVASNAPLSAAMLQTWMRPGEQYVIKDGTDLTTFVGNEPVLRDDFAPVDQLKTSSRFFRKAS